MKLHSLLPAAFGAAWTIGYFGVGCAATGGGTDTKPINTAGDAEAVLPDGGEGFGDARPPAEDSCEAAVKEKSYVGCDYWPTPVANAVWSMFDFTVVISNVGKQDARIRVTGFNGIVDENVNVPPGEIAKIYLPWIPELKGKDADECGRPDTLQYSVHSKRGAYHLVSSSPVVVYQFNALEYAGKGGPVGKDWSFCPGTVQACMSRDDKKPIGCYSYSNDASLLLPTTAMTGNYRITGVKGWSLPSQNDGGAPVPIMPSYAAITATMDDTTVTVQTPASGQVKSDDPYLGTFPGANGGQPFSITLNAGEVFQMATESGAQFDLSGGLIKANHPVQVITGIACTNIPANKDSCDHVEESVFPVETHGKRYVVTVPTAPSGQPVRHLVRFYGNFDGTKLTYAPIKPAGCPDTLEAGAVAECADTVGEDFQVSGDQAFAVASFMLGSTVVDSRGGRGDPSQSLVVATEQFRDHYVVLAPDDYDISFIDVVLPTQAIVKIDGEPIATEPKALGETGYAVARAKLARTPSGRHLIESTKPVGVQVLGYGHSTSYQYPGGLDFAQIGTVPPH